MVIRRKVRIGLNGIEDRPDLAALLKDYDPERALASLRKGVGAIAPESRQRILEEIYEERE